MNDLSGNVRLLTVSLQLGQKPVKVGRLASNRRTIYFEYDLAFLSKNIEISPFRLPLKSGIQEFDPVLFEGLPGVFYDSLPDGWGRLLMDRSLRANGIQIDKVSPLDRLAYVGNSGMGALAYQPDYSESPPNGPIDLDRLAEHSRKILNGDSTDVIRQMLDLNGSSGGARPKAMISVNKDMSRIAQGIDHLPVGHEPWMVKFGNTQDGIDAGAIEYVYALMAKMAGVEMMETHLFPAMSGAGYFATKRFDRIEDGGRLHVLSACGLLHSDYRYPSLDYQDLIKATMILTKDVREAHKMFRLAVFNVLSHNRDDHSKNFSFIMDKEGGWRLSPAYDLTFSSGPLGEQSTMVMGEGKNPEVNHLYELAKHADMSDKEARDIVDQTKEALHQWKKLATSHGVLKANIKRIAELITA